MGIDRMVRWSGALVALAMVVSACGGGGGGSTPSAVVPTQTPVTPTPTPAPTGTASSTPISPTAWTCPTSQSATTSLTRATASLDAPGRLPATTPQSAPRPTSFLAVAYDRTTAARSTQSIAANETRVGATFVRSFDLNAIGATVRVVAVPASAAGSAAAQLRGAAGVRSVSETGLPQHLFNVAKATFTNDPYFAGFQTTVAPGATSTPPPPTYHQLPYVTSSNVPGQWDMHALRLAYALSYTSSDPSVNPSGKVTGTLGNGITIAIIDTGVDANHPELTSKVALQRCFLTNPSGTQNTGLFATDPDGHGTNVAGIAAAAQNNAFGFAGAGGAATIYAYRVFPTPNDSCATPSSTNQQCETSSFDTTSAINDAVARGVDVISLSLGGGTCTNGQDPDPAGQGLAIKNALAAGVIVVAAAGNDAPKTASVAAPACDSGVIAVGSSSLADGQPNGSGVGGGTAAQPIEYVASYSQAGSPGAMPKNASAWGIVAPGGDPKPDPDPNDTTGLTADNDDLHWIENIWTTTPFDANFAGACKADYGMTSGPNDCRTLIAGTSQATPHVAGAVAVILAANRSYHTPSMMKQLLCATADDIADAREGCGRLNLERALGVALGDPTPN